jgi:hypothetical protein
MHRIRSLITALALIAISAGVAVAHSQPSASDAGIATAQAASDRAVPMWRIPEGPSLDQPTDESQPTNESSDTHGATVSDAASNPTPEGDWANHGAYVSSIAKDWGAAVSSEHANSQAAAHNEQGLSHRP